MTSNREILKASKKALRYTRGELFGISVPAILLGGINLFSFFLIQVILIILPHNLRSGHFGSYTQLLKYFYLGLALYTLIALVFGSYIEIGLDRILLQTMKGKKETSDMLFYYRPVIMESIYLRLFSAIKVALWTILLVVPGFVAILNYSFAPFIFAQDPHISAPEAIKLSKYLMKGYKWKLLMIFLSFMDEILISILLLGIPFFYVIPRIRCATAAFYLDRIKAHNEEVTMITNMAMDNKTK